MPGIAGPKDGVALLAYVPGIHVLGTGRKTWMAGINPAMTGLLCLCLPFTEGEHVQPEAPAGDREQQHGFER